MIYVNPTSNRIPHIEPLFEDKSFVSDYDHAIKKLATADYDPVYDFILNGLDKNSSARILEIGPGPGWLGIILAQKCPQFQIIGLDTSEQYLESARENAAQEGVADQITYLQGDVCYMEDLDSQSFDAVISSQSLHYWSPARNAFNEIARVLKPGGLFCIEDERRDLTFRGKLAVMLGKYLMARQVRHSWMRSIDGSYTPEELKPLLENSDLQDSYELIIRSRLLFVQGQLDE